MTDHGRQDFERFTGPNPAGTEEVASAHANSQDNARLPIGVVLEISGSGSQIALDLQRLNECMKDADPSIALAGQVGSQIKIRVGNGWLLASVRTQRQDSKTPGGILAAIALPAYQDYTLRAKVAQGIADCVPLAPLHNPANLSGIRALQALTAVRLLLGAGVALWLAVQAGRLPWIALVLAAAVVRSSRKDSGRGVSRSSR